MSRLGMLLALLLLAASNGHAQTGDGTTNFCGYSFVRTPNSNDLVSGTTGYASGSITNAVTSPTILKLTGSGASRIVGALIFIESATIRERHDGVAPTADSGMQYGPGAPGGSAFRVCGSDFQVAGTARLKWTAAPSTGTAKFFIWTYVDGQ